MHEFRTQRRIEFADTDMAGIVHFSRFFVFMESAEHQFLESLGMQVHFAQDGEEIGWPRVSVQCDYRNPALFGDVLDIRVFVQRKGTKSVTWGFEFTRDGDPIANGKISAICCALGKPPGPSVERGKKHLRAIPIPAEIADQLDEAPTGD